MSLSILKLVSVAMAAATVPVGLSIQAVGGHRQSDPVAMTTLLPGSRRADARKAIRVSSGNSTSLSKS
jgi:hypothetical protein